LTLTLTLPLHRQAESAWPRRKLWLQPTIHDWLDGHAEQRIDEVISARAVVPGCMDRRDKGVADPVVPLMYPGV
jgi:hypothetical protein